MAKNAEEIIIQTKPFLWATLFIYAFILPCMCYFCGPRKIVASCLEGGYHLNTSTVLFISGEKAQWYLCRRMPREQYVCIPGDKANPNGWFWASLSVTQRQLLPDLLELKQLPQPILPNGLANAVYPFNVMSQLHDLESVLLKLHYCPLLLPLKSWPIVFVLWN